MNIVEQQANLQQTHTHTHTHTLIHAHTHTTHTVHMRKAGAHTHTHTHKHFLRHNYINKTKGHNICDYVKGSVKESLDKGKPAKRREEEDRNPKKEIGTVVLTVNLAKVSDFRRHRFTKPRSSHIAWHA